MMIENKEYIMEDYKPAYWNGEGQYQDLYNELQDFIPGMGSVLDAENEAKVREDLPLGSPKLGRKGKFYHLEALRLAANQYYDLYNNGLMNRSAGFAKRFGVTKNEAVRWNFGDEDSHKKIDTVMDSLILNAAKEIGLWPMDAKSVVRDTVGLEGRSIRSIEAEEAKVKAAIEHESRPVVTVSSDRSYEEQVPLATVS